jgi:hypothetical protein
MLVSVMASHKGMEKPLEVFAMSEEVMSAMRQMTISLRGLIF